MNHYSIILIPALLLTSACQLPSVERPIDRPSTIRASWCPMCKLANDAVLSKHSEYSRTLFIAGEATSGFGDSDRWSALFGNTIFSSFPESVDSIVAGSPAQYVRVPNTKYVTQSHITMCNQENVVSAVNTGYKVIFADATLDYYEENVATEILDYDLFANFTDNGDRGTGSTKSGSSLSTDEAQVTVRMFDCSTRRLAFDPVVNKLFVHSGANDQSLYLIPMQGGAFVTKMAMFAEPRRKAIDYALSVSAAIAVMRLAYLPAEIERHLSMDTTLDIDIGMNLDGDNVCLRTDSSKEFSEPLSMLVRMIGNDGIETPGVLNQLEVGEKTCFRFAKRPSTLIAQIVDSKGDLRGQLTSTISSTKER